MADISKITLPSGNTYDIKDATARELIAGGISFTICWDGASTPVVANIPAGVVVTYNGTDYTGTKAASTAEPGTFYLVKSGTSPNAYDEYVAATVGSTKTWERLGGKDIDLSFLGDLAYEDNVTLGKGSGDNVLGEATTFTNSTSSVSFAAHTTDKCLGSDATFSTSVTPTTTNIKATASGTAVGANGTATVVTGYATPATDKCLGSDATFTTTVTPSTSKLVTTTIPNVTNNEAVNFTDYSFAMGTGDNSETLIITPTSKSSTKVTLGTAITAATGSLAANGGGASVATGISSASTSTNSKDEVTALTGLGSASTETVLTGVKVTSQPTIALATGASAGTGVISVATGIDSATTTTSAKDEVTAITALGAGTAAAQTITVGTNDKVKVAKYDDLSVTVS